MPLALITGTHQHLGPAAATLGKAGFDVLTWAFGSPAAPTEGPFDCYVQLPCAGSDPASPSRRSPDDLVCRVDALAAVTGRLKPNASILLAVEDGDSGDSAQRGVLAPDLLAAVAGALLEDLGRSASRLAVVPVAGLCRRLPPAAQWEMPTPPLVSAP